LRLFFVLQGRFKDTFVDVMEQIKVEELLPTKRLGPLVCVAVIEGSSHPKSRLLACKECHNCVKKIGLSGIGKRGVLAFAKSLSEEKLQENRNSLVDLMVMLLSRMNGDMQRFTRICGSSLSGKARALIEEQMGKGDSAGQTGIPRSSIAKPSPRRDSRRLSNTPKPARTTPSKLPALRPKETPTGVRGTARETTSDEGFEDELPALDLRLGTRTTPSGSTGIPRAVDVENMRISSMSRFTSSPPREASPSITGDDNSIDEKDLDPRQPEDADSEEKESIRTELFSASDGLIETNDSSDSGGAAASLRARLMKIRERNRNTVPVPSQESNKNDDVSSKKVEGHESLVSTAKENVDNEAGPADAIATVGLQAEESFAVDDTVEAKISIGPLLLEGYLDTIRHLLARSLPLSEDDDEIIESTDVLKSIHAAVSQQANLAVDLNEAAVTQLRSEIRNHSNEVVETLTRYDRYAQIMYWKLHCTSTSNLLISSD
jgi:hypothetical protein